MGVGQCVGSADDLTMRSSKKVADGRLVDSTVILVNGVTKCMSVKELPGVKDTKWWMVDDHCTGGSSDWESI